MTIARNSEPASALSLWQRRIIGVLTLGGSTLGGILILQQAYAGHIAGLGWLLALLFLVAYAYGVVIGTALIEGSETGRTMAVPFWAAQIPVLYSSAITYVFSSGAFGNVIFSAGGTVNFNGMLGSQFQFYLGTDTDFGIGLNIVAVVVLYQLLTARPSADIGDATGHQGS